MGLGHALDKLRSARDDIARIAARWQAGGHDTSPLAEPLVRIQEAIGDLESREAEAARAAAEYPAPAPPRAVSADTTSLDG